MDDELLDAVDEGASALRRRKQLRAMFILGALAFVAVTGTGVYSMITTGSWDKEIWMAMMVSGSVMASAAGIYQWGLHKRLEKR